MYRDTALKSSQVYELAYWFWEGRESVANDPLVGGPVSMRNEENLERVDNLLTMNHQTLVHYSLDALGINRKAVCLIISHNLLMRKPCACMVPKSLMAEQKQHRFNVCNDWIGQCIGDENFLNKVVTEDKL